MRYTEIPSLQSWRAVIKKDLRLIVHRVKPAHKRALADWVEQF